ncbi:MAG: hypothetical protein IPL99_15815 [Candidatus Competibacteraceae bacterium]|nr:hypothetical protein [Candidatus Competibacteraceae bacterium]
MLKNPLLSSADMLEPWARQALAAAGQPGETLILSLDQTDLGNRFAILMISLGWAIERCRWLGRWKPARRISVLRPSTPCWSGRGRGSAGAEVLLCADRFILQWAYSGG